jgi:hypothetical protein
MHIPTAQPRRQLQCFMAVNNWNRWWNARVHSYLTTEDRPSVTFSTGMQRNAHQGTHCSEAVSYTLINKAGPHRDQPTTEAHRLAHIGFAWSLPRNSGQALESYITMTNKINRNLNHNRRPPFGRSLGRRAVVHQRTNPLQSSQASEYTLTKQTSTQITGKYAKL